MTVVNESSIIYMFCSLATEVTLVRVNQYCGFHLCVITLQVIHNNQASPKPPLFTDYLSVLKLRVNGQYTVSSLGSALQIWKQIMAINI